VTIRTLIVDDEPPAREKIARHLSFHDDIRIVGECGDGESAVKGILSANPDLIFLDIHLPEFDGFEVLRRAATNKRFAVIFVTAYDEYALRAFDVQALDYLVKPFDDERFQVALQRGREQVAFLRNLDGSPAAQAKHESLANRVLVQCAGRIRILNLDEIDWIEAAGNYVRLHVGAESYLYRDTMNNLESTLDPRKFLRIHRRTIVSIDRIKELQPMFKGAYTVVLRDNTELTLSPLYRHRLSL
jgi:two-component system LytT family response regulator